MEDPKDDPTDKKPIHERRQDIIEDRHKSAKHNLSIANRLTRRSKTLIEEIPLEDEEGEFVIQVRQPTRKQLDSLLKFKEDIKKEDRDIQEKANDELYRLLGSICVDESLDYDYWKEGDYSLTDLMDIITKLFEQYVKRYKDVESFR